MFPKSTHETFAQKMYQTYKGHKRFSKPKLARTDFTVNHYAGDVTYQADLFLDKNKDYVIAEHQALLNSSTCPFVANLFPPLAEETSKQSKFSSIGSRFKLQLQSLMDTLSTTEPHYIRCVKPNTVLKPGIFENHNVLNQLRCGGVLEAIRISCAGYPTKRTFDEFLDRFGMLIPEISDGSDEKSACMALCDKMGLKGYQMGKTKVFLRAGQMAELDARRTEILANAVKQIQRQIRTHLTRKEFITLRKATIDLQKIWRAQLARKLYDDMRREAASIRIQKYARTHAARKSYISLKASVIVIQTGLRAMAARNEFRHRRRSNAALIIQTRWRMSQAVSAYKQLKRANIILQCLWRSRVARKELKMLRIAARDTGALKEAKDKLEKRVEELTWRLDIEKHMRTDLEEAKGQEISKLQEALSEMQLQLDEAHAAIIREKEEAKLAIEQAPPVIIEVPVVDNTKLDLLTNQNNQLEGDIMELKKKIEEFEELHKKVESERKEWAREAEESQQRTTQLQETIEKLELSLSNLESENQVLRQQALVATENEDMSEEMKILRNKIAELESEKELLQTQAVVTEKMVAIPLPVSTVEAIHHKEEEDLIQTVKVCDEERFQSSGPPNFTTLTKQKSLTERQQENHDVLIKYLMEDKRFDKERSIAACIVYKVLLQWRSFEAEKTQIFDKIIHTIRISIEDCENNACDMAYWLSTTSTLLYFIQTSLKASSSSQNVTRQRNRSSATLFGRKAQALRSTSMGISSGYSGMVGKREEQSSAKYPALLFKQHLTAYVEKIYGMIRDNLKKEISPLLHLCIQVPRSSRARSLKGSSKTKSSIVAKQQASNVHWKTIINKLDDTLRILSESYVSTMIIQKVFSQVFSYINVQIFNSLLLRRECCSSSNGEYLKAGLQELEHWCFKVTDQLAGSPWEELKHIRQAVGFLVLHQKAQKSFDEITIQLFPILSIPQIYRIGTMFWDDKYGTHGLSPDVIGKMRALMTQDSINLLNNSFLLDVDSSVPFTMEETYQSLVHINPSEVNPPEHLRQRSDFHFLFQQLE